MKLIFYYSGSSGSLAQGKMVAQPELVLPKTNLMLSYYLISQKWQCQDLRIKMIRSIRRANKKGRK